MHSIDDDKASLISQPTYKSKCRIILIGLSASLSSVIQGYAIKQITSIPIQTFQRNYDTTMDKNLLEGLLMGIMPLGGLLGSLMSNFLITTVTRRQGMHVGVPLLALSTLLIQITTVATLFLGRFIEGICIGYYISIAPIYLQQITPKELKSIIGTFFGLGKIVGVLLSITLALLLGEEAWRFLLSVNLMLSITQSILIQTIGSDTALQWISRNDKQKAREAINQIYLQDEAQKILQQMVLDFQMQKDKRNQKTSDASIMKKKKTAFMTAIGACLSRHLTGGNALITAAGVIMSKYSQQLAKWTPISINTIQLLSVCTYTFFFTKSLGKRTILVYSSGLLALINAILVFSLIFSNKEGIFLSVATFMMVYGILLSVTWSYPSQILSASQALVPNIMHWLGLSLSTLAPFFIMAAMPNNEVYPCFIFFTLYSLFSCIFFQAFAVESNGLNYQSIIVKFKEW